MPGWVNVVCGLTLFLYQTLDAVDGKQARRTKSSSALGQLFDHGCDAMSTFIGALSLCVCQQTGAARGLTFVTFACFAFFIAQWNEYYTHVLSTNVAGVFGVTEAQVSGCRNELSSIHVSRLPGISGSPHQRELIDISLCISLFPPPRHSCW